MKTLYLSLSPKKRWSNSAYLAATARLFSGRDSTVLHYRGRKDVPRLMEELKGGCRLVLVMPLFVDGIPSHVLELMDLIQAHTQKEPFPLEVYSILNCGFYEGEQCEYALEMVECWCLRCGFTFLGGRGIGAGEMFGVMRLNLLVGVLLLVVDFLISLVGALSGGAATIGAVLGGMHPMGGLITIGLGILWSLGGWFAAAKVGRCAAKGLPCPIRYTTVTFCPAFLFVCFASLYWMLRAFLLHFVPVWKLFRKLY